MLVRVVHLHPCLLCICPHVPFHPLCPLQRALDVTAGWDMCVSVWVCVCKCACVSKSRTAARSLWKGRGMGGMGGWWSWITFGPAAGSCFVPLFLSDPCWPGTRPSVTHTHKHTHTCAHTHLDAVRHIHTPTHTRKCEYLLIHTTDTCTHAHKLFNRPGPVGTIYHDLIR